MDEARELFRNPKFVAIWLATWAGFVLALVNIYEKIYLLTQLGQ